jgi:NAD(P)-dependent dehydrogenase (short-subunit alcohol dehydrogenase family)
MLPPTKKKSWEKQMGRLDGKVAVITGGASGIGRGTVDLFVAEGAKVVVGDIQDDKGAHVEEAHGASATYIHTDVSDETQVKAMIDLAVEKYGRLDCIFNNAGYVGHPGGVVDVTAEGFGQTMDILVLGVMLGMKHAAPIMAKQGGGSIVNTASVAGISTSYGPIIYSVAKAAVMHASKWAAIDLAEHSIRVNAICPGGIVTPIFAKAMGAPSQLADKSLEIVEKAFEDLQPMPRSGLPKDIAEAALFLASDGSSFITGQSIAVDGGLTSGRRRVEEEDGGAFAPLVEMLMESIEPQKL